MVVKPPLIEPAVRMSEGLADRWAEAVAQGDVQFAAEGGGAGDAQHAVIRSASGAGDPKIQETFIADHEAAAHVVDSAGQGE